MEKRKVSKNDIKNTDILTLDHKKKTTQTKMLYKTEGVQVSEPLLKLNTKIRIWCSMLSCWKDCQ